MTEYHETEHGSPDARPPAWVAIALVAILTPLVVFAITRNLPWLISENRRLEPWKLPLVWSSEVVATLAFLHYALCAVLPARWLPALRRRWTGRAFLIGLTLDLGYSLDELGVERWAYARASPAEGRVVMGHAFESIGRRRYSFSCSFRDDAGTPRLAWFSMLGRELPGPTRAAIDQGKLPVPIRLFHDPSWPERSWVANVPFSDNNRIYVYSLLSLLFSGLITLNLAVHSSMFGMRRLPPPETGPLFGAIFLLCFYALLQGW